MIRIILMLLTSCVFANEISIVADSSVIDNTKQIMSYSGNVEITSDNIKINAATVVVTIINRANKIYKITATSDDNLATMSKTNEFFNAKAQTIVYDNANSVINLIGNAEIIKENTTMRAANILYDLTQNKIITKSDNNSKIRFIIEP